jgi:hypothetical protein
MKNIIFGFLALAIVQPAFGSDRFENEIACAKVTKLRYLKTF